MPPSLTGTTVAAALHDESVSSVLATRIPMLRRLSKESQSRLDERRSLGLLNQHPPRITLGGWPLITSKRCKLHSVRAKLSSGAPA